MKFARDSYLARRFALSLSQQDVADRARLSRKTVSEFENGKDSMSVANLQRLLGAVGLELTVRDRSRRPTLDEVAERYRPGESAPEPSQRRRVRRKSPP